MKVATCKCGREFTSKKVNPKYCSRQCLYLFRIRPSGLKYSLKQENQGWFKRGSKPRVSFPKGNIPWNKGVGEYEPRISIKGYRLFYTPNHPNADKDGYIYEHRLILEKELGRFLESKEIVHHINENKLDNRIENLILTNRSEHITIYHPFK